MFKYGFNGNVEIMNSQILVQKVHQDLQSIVFGKSINSLINEYKLKSVTFGTTEAAKPCQTNLSLASL